MRDIRRQESAPIVGANPFFHRGAIRYPSYFYGRGRETGLLLDLVRQGQSVSVLGQRRIGKTSLLLHVADPTVFRDHGVYADRVVFVYASCEGRESLSGDDVLRLLLKSAAASLTDPNDAERPLEIPARLSFDAFEDCLSSWMRPDQQLVFLFDEFESLTVNPNLGPQFFSGLRRIATEKPISYVTATKQSLMALTDAGESALSSPFFNFLHTLHLGLFTHDESVQMIQDLSYKADQAFPKELVEFLLDLAGGHPFFLQLASYHAFETLRSANGTLVDKDYEQIQERFWTTAAQHLRYYWSHLDGDARHVLSTLPLQADSRSTTLSELEDECLIVREEGRYRYASNAIRDFVRSQTVPGLIKAGPFVVDVQQNAVLMNECPIELTKTEFGLFKYLIEQPGEVATFDQLEQGVWGDTFTGDPERLKAAVKHLRNALGDGAPHIVNVRGVGYTFLPVVVDSQSEI